MSRPQTFYTSPCSTNPHQRTGVPANQRLYLCDVMDAVVVMATAAAFFIACLLLQNQMRITSRLKPSTVAKRVISAPASTVLLTCLLTHIRRPLTRTGCWSETASVPAQFR